MNITIEKWLPDLMPRLPGATEELILAETLATIRELCEDGRAWVEEVGPYHVNDKGVIYIDPLFQDARTGYVLQLKVDGRGIPFEMVDTGTIRPLYNSVNGKFTVIVSFVPLHARTRLPQMFWTHWRDAVIDGVCYRMMTMPSKPWSSAQGAMLNGRRFRNHVKRCRMITKHMTQGEHPWQFPRSAM